MLPWIKLDETTMPGGGVLKLMQRGSEFSIMSGTIELMNSRLSGSEEQLATLSATRIGTRLTPRILIGGLGMGFTLRAALATFGAEAEIVVAELVPAVVEWARGPLAAIHGTSLDDPRVTLHRGDVATAITPEKPFDAILLDVDNGPDGLSRPPMTGSTAPPDSPPPGPPSRRAGIWPSGPRRPMRGSPNASNSPA